jgi:uncharacterized protein YjgD (DUF1641 family)
MAEQDIQQQIAELNRKLDLVLESVEQQRRTREQWKDLIEDVSIVGKDAFQNTVIALDKAGVELDSDALAKLAIRLVKNVGTFNELLETLESVNDFVKDASPIFHQIGLDAINKLAELEREGYLGYARELMSLMKELKERLTLEDLQNLRNNLGSLMNVVRNLSQPEMIHSLESASMVIATTKMDDKLDNKSILKLFGELNSPEVRKTLFYSLRVLKEISKANTK